MEKKWDYFTISDMPPYQLLCKSGGSNLSLLVTELAPGLLYLYLCSAVLGSDAQQCVRD